MRFLWHNNPRHETQIQSPLKEPQPTFRFQRFSVADSACAHKVGTDGVLLGAWADIAKAQRIVDVGTGSGLIALMLAQRSEAFARPPEICGVDQDPAAVRQAAENFRRSPWSCRLVAEFGRIQEFASCPEFDAVTNRYDVVVCNPPFFAGIGTGDVRRNAARLDGSLPVADLFRSAATLLGQSGRVILIWPFQRLEAVMAAAHTARFCLARQVDVFPLPNRDAVRALLEFHRVSCTEVERSTLVIERAKHEYTPEYQHLTSGFYL